MDSAQNDIYDKSQIMKILKPEIFIDIFRKIISIV